MNKSIFSWGLLVIVLILIIISLFGPWYTHRISFSSSEGINTIELTNYLRNGNYQIQTYEETKSMEIDYGNIDLNSNVNSNNFYIFDIVYYLTIITLIICLLAIIFICPFLFNVYKPNSIHKILKSFSFFTILLLITIIIFFAVSTHITLDDNLIGYEIENLNFWTDSTINYQGFNLRSTTGPGYSWYLMICSVIFYIPAVFFLRDDLINENLKIRIGNKNFPQSSDTKYCPRCRNTTSFSSRYCNKCGWNFSKY
jgi:hypothetical protein